MSADVRTIPYWSLAAETLPITQFQTTAMSLRIDPFQKSRVRFSTHQHQHLDSNQVLPQVHCFSIHHMVASGGAAAQNVSGRASRTLCCSNSSSCRMSGYEQSYPGAIYILSLSRSVCSIRTQGRGKRQSWSDSFTACFHTLLQNSDVVAMSAQKIMLTAVQPLGSNQVFPHIHCSSRQCASGCAS